MAKIPTILEPGRADGKLATSGAIFDENKNMFQSEINDIQDTLNSDNPNKPLSAKQGKILKELLDTKAIEVGAVPMDDEPTEGNTTHVTTSDGINRALSKKVNNDTFKEINEKQDKKLSELEVQTIKSLDITTIGSGGEKTIGSITTSGLNVTLLFPNYLVLYGVPSVDGTVADSYKTIEITEVTLSNLQALVVDIVNGIYEVVPFEKTTNIKTIFDDPGKIVVLMNIWGKVLSPISSLQTEILQLTVESNVNKKLDENVESYRINDINKHFISFMMAGGGKAITAISYAQSPMSASITFASNIVSCYSISSSKCFEYKDLTCLGNQTITIGNLEVLIIDIDNNSYEVKSIIGNDYSILNGNKVLLVCNLWNYLVSPIASINSELSYYISGGIATLQKSLTSKTILSTCTSSGGTNIISSLTTSSNGCSITLQDFTILGSSAGEKSYVSFTGGTYVIPNTHALIANLSTKELSVIAFDSANTVLSLLDADKVLVFANLWNTIMSPIASVQTEIARVLSEGEFKIFDIFASTKVGENPAFTNKIIGYAGLAKEIVTKESDYTLFNTPYFEQLITTENTDLYAYKVSINQCSDVQFYFKARCTSAYAATIYFQKNNSWLHNENAVTKNFNKSDAIPQKSINIISRPYEEGADTAYIFIGAGGTSGLAVGNTIQIGNLNCVLKNSIKTQEEIIEPIVITVASDGSGDFTSVREANLSITDASMKKPYKIFIKNGTYKEMDIKTKSYVDIEGESREGVILHADGLSTTDSGPDYSLSPNENSNVPINTIAKAHKHLFLHISNSTISNLTMKVNNCKYVIHQDSGPRWYKAVVKNCAIIRDEDYLTNTDSYDQGLQNLIGVGAAAGEYQEYYNCDFYFKTSNIPNNRNITPCCLYWHNWNNQGVPAGATLKDCNIYDCHIAYITDLGSDATDVINLENITVNNKKWGIFYSLTPGYYKKDGELVTDYTLIPYCIKVNIRNTNVNYVVADSNRLMFLDKIINPYTIEHVCVGSSVAIGQPISVNNFYFGSSQIATSGSFVFALENKNANNICAVNKGLIGTGLCVAGNYVFGDDIYILNGKFTNTQNGEVVGKCIETKNLTTDGYIWIKKRE